MDADQQPSLSDELARARTHLAAERTLMAWVRTSLSMIGFGFGIDKIVETLRSSEISFVAQLESGVRWFGIGIVVLGVYAMWASLGEYRRTLSRMTGGSLGAGPERSVASTVSKWLIVIGMFAVINLLWTLVH